MSDIEFEEKFKTFKILIDQCVVYQYEDFFVSLNNDFKKCESIDGKRKFVENMIENKILEKFLRKKKLQKIKILQQ